jgi:hypothetical protein
MPPTPVVAPTGHTQTLGEAAAEAARVKHARAVSGNIVPTFDAAAATARQAAVTPTAVSDVPAIAAASVADEATWKTRARALKTALSCTKRTAQSGQRPRCIGRATRRKQALMTKPNDRL